MTDKYILLETNEENALQISFLVRQNCWQHCDDPINIVKTIMKIHLPWAHTKIQTDLFMRNRERFLEIAKHFARNAVNTIKKDTIGIMEGYGRGLIIKITSDVKCGVNGLMKDVCIVRKSRSCNHEFTYPGHDMGGIKACKECVESIVSVILVNDTKEIHNAISKGYIIEPFYSPYYEIEVLGEVDYHVHKKTIVPITSFCSAIRYFRKVTSNNPFDGFD